MHEQIALQRKPKTLAMSRWNGGTGYIEWDIRHELCTCGSAYRHPYWKKAPAVHYPFSCTSVRLKRCNHSTKATRPICNSCLQSPDGGQHEKCAKYVVYVRHCQGHNILWYVYQSRYSIFQRSVYLPKHLVWHIKVLPFFSHPGRDVMHEVPLKTGCSLWPQLQVISCISYDRKTHGYNVKI